MLEEGGNGTRRLGYLLAAHLSIPVCVVAQYLCVLLLLICVAGCGQSEPPKPLPPTAMLESHAQQFDGQTCSILGGDAYLKDAGSQSWKFYRHLYDADFIKKNYVIENGIIYRFGDDGVKRYAMSRHFNADFENAATLQDLIGEKYHFTSVVLQSPAAPTVADYVKLRAAILKGERTFIDNRVEPSTEKAHFGKQALKAHAVAPSHGMQCAKALIESEFLHFVKGDDYWFSGWYFIAEGMPFSISDIKSSWIDETPGLRLRFEDGAPQFELKWADKPVYKQSASKPVKFPLQRWVHVQIHLKLSDENDGLNELWVDGQQLIQAKGRNMPLPDAVYNHVEVGITATLQESTVFVDDVEVSDNAVGMEK